MKDMMMEIYSALMANPTIADLVGPKRIKFYQLEDSFEASTGPFIIIDTLNPQQSAYFVADKVASKQFAYQINVESTASNITKQLAKAVEDVMRANGFGQLSGGLDTYFKETKRFVDARRYRKNTTIHDTDY